MVSIYEHPPITEAVVEFRLKNNLDRKVAEKAASAFSSNYPRQEVSEQIFIHLGPTPPKDAPVRTIKRMTGDAAEVVLLKGNSLTVAQLAPYPGWEVFVERVKRDWSTWRKRTDFRELGRIGVRYINRIDIPMKPDSHIPIENFLKMLPLVPNEVEAVTAFQMRVVSSLSELGANVSFGVASVDSPLLEHTSFSLDIDIGLDKNLPQKEDEIFGYLDKVRVEKNRLFEALLTDEAKALFR